MIVKPKCAEQFVIDPLVWEIRKDKEVGRTHKNQEANPCISQACPYKIRELHFFAHDGFKPVFTGKVAEQHDNRADPKQNGRFPHDKAVVFQ